MYIIIWRNNHRDPFVDQNPTEFLETYSTPELAKKEAERVMSEHPKSPWYFDYKIYKEENI